MKAVKVEKSKVHLSQKKRFKPLLSEILCNHEVWPIMSIEKRKTHIRQSMCWMNLADSSHLPNVFRADKYLFFGIFMYVMSWYSRASVMFSVFA